MFGLSYLSSDKKLLLAKLQDRLASAESPRVHNETELSIQQILSEAIPYTQCDLMQADELRSQLMRQITTLQGLGKIASVESFLMHLRDLEFYIQTKKMEETLAEQTRLKNDQPPNLRNDRTPSLNSHDREKKKKKQTFGRTRWTVDMDEDVKSEQREDD